MAFARLRETLTGARRRDESADPFDPTFLARLDRVRLRFGRASGARPGETAVRGASQSSGIELESFKSYPPGDDIRSVDWIALGRLDQLFTRRFVPEREIPLHILLDASASMGVPESSGKFRFAIRVIAALAYIALNHNDSVRVSAFRRSGEKLEVEETPVLRHRGRLFELKPFLAGIRPSGETARVEGMTRYLERHRESGLMFLLSDFLVEPSSYEDALTRAKARRLEVRGIHVVGQQERELGSVRGRLRLRDVETGETREVAVSEADRKRYRQHFEERLSRLRDFCHRYGAGHAVAVADDGVELFLTRTLAAQGLLEFR